MLPSDDILVPRRSDENVNVSNDFVQTHYAEPFHASLKRQYSAFNVSIDFDQTHYTLDQNLVFTKLFKENNHIYRN